MTNREYLNQAYRIDARINSKLEQVMSMRGLLTRTNATLSDMPGNPNRDRSKMEETVVKIVDMENEINADIDRLVNLKREIMQVIKAVDNMEYQMLLELRFLCFKTWEEIAVELGYSIRQIYRLRDDAIDSISISENGSQCQ